MTPDKREQNPHMRLPPTEASAPSLGEASNSVPAQMALLQKHKALNSQVMLLQCGSRSACLLAIGFLAAGPPCTVFTATAVCTAYILLLLIWTMEQSCLLDRIYSLERALAETARGVWEDTVIRSTKPEGHGYYHPWEMVDWVVEIYLGIFRRERLVWFLMLVAVIGLRIAVLAFPGLSKSL